MGRVPIVPSGAASMSHCQICGRSDRGEIEGLLLAEVGLREVAGQFGVSKSAVHRHLRKCMKAQRANEPANAAPSGAQGRLRQLYERVEKLLARAEKGGDTKSA